MKNPKSSPLLEIARFVGWLFLPLVVGGISGLVTAGSVETWYRTIEKPFFNPPGWVFGPVWTALYLMMGLAAYLAFRESPRTGTDRPLPRPGRPSNSTVRSAKAAFLVQLALNGLWSLVFFGLHRPGWALIEIVLLWLAIGWTVRAFGRLSKVAAWLLVPYWAWVSFASVLNGAIWWLNR